MWGKVQYFVELNQVPNLGMTIIGTIRGNLRNPNSFTFILVRKWTHYLSKNPRPVCGTIRIRICVFRDTVIVLPQATALNKSVSQRIYENLFAGFGSLEDNHAIQYCNHA